jgi:hypothetical protein
MNKKNKLNLLGFITRTGMYINPVDNINITSFINGYLLADDECDFLQIYKNLLIKKYNIPYTSDGWPGQTTRFCNVQLLDWVVAFKQISLEIIIENQDKNLDPELIKILKSRITSLIKKIDTNNNIWFNNQWEKEWISLCIIQNPVFKLMWTKDEWEIIYCITKIVQLDSIFYKDNINTSIDKLKSLRDQYEILESKKNNI